MLKLSDNPPMRWPHVPLDQFQPPWHVAHTKARCEKAFAWDLYRAQTAYFLPMIQRVTFSGGRKRHGMRPLFPGYVFFIGDDATRLRALSTNRLCQVIAVSDQATLIHELMSLQRALDGKATLDPYPFAVVGRRCRITHGPFAGVEGVIDRREDTWRLVLRVTMLGQSVAMEVDAGELEETQ